MAVIENDIQYNWVRRRISKLKEKVDESTPLDNRYRIELELLSKLEKEYSEEHPYVLKPVIEDFERTPINVYEGMEIVAEMVKMKAFSETSGKQQSWWSCKMNHIVRKGKECRFEESDLPVLNETIKIIASQLTEFQIVFNTNREAVVEQIHKLDTIISMPYIYDKVMGKGREWYMNRMRKTLANRRPYYFKEDDIQIINNAIITISNRLKSIELVL